MFITIIVTFEEENREQLQFLDVLFIRNINKLEFDFYRKDTSIYRCIPKKSHYCFQSRMLSLNFLIHRLTNFSLTPKSIEKEKHVIQDILISNDTLQTL